MTNYVLKLEPLAITKTVVVILVLVIGMLAAKNGHTSQEEKYVMLGGGAVLIGIGTLFCTIKPEILYFFGIIVLTIGSIGVTSFALTGPRDYFIVHLPNGFALLDLIVAQLTLVIVVMLLAVIRIGKHFLEDKVLVEEFC